jgi:hypothetical protein
VTTAYTEFRYIEPPYTKVKRAYEFLDEYEGKGWWAQLKLNGTRNVSFVNPDHVVCGWNRHGQPQKAWHYDRTNSKLLCRGEGWNIYDSELMHNKTPHIKDTNYLYDILVHDGQHLIGTTYRERYNLLKQMFPARGQGIGYWIIDEHFWLAQNYERNFRQIFDQVTQLVPGGKEPMFPHIEGLVLKDPNGVYRTSDASGWMIKFRRDRVPSTRRRAA